MEREICNQYIDEKNVVDERVIIITTKQNLFVALKIDKSTKLIQGQPYIQSKIPWLKVLSSLETIMILFSELRDIYVCFRLMTTMMEAIVERTYSAKHATLSLMTSFEIDAMIWELIRTQCWIGNSTRISKLFSDKFPL